MVKKKKPIETKNINEKYQLSIEKIYQSYTKFLLNINNGLNNLTDLKSKFLLDDFNEKILNKKMDTLIALKEKSNPTKEAVNNLI